MVAGLTQFASDTSGLSALGVNGGAFIVQLLTFLVVFLILKRWAFGPILRKLEERRTLIESGVTLGEEMQAKIAQAETEAADKLRAARDQADKLISEAETAAREQAQAAEEAARQRTEAMIQSAHRQIKLTSAREREQLEKELLTLVSDVSAVVIGEKLDPKHDAGLIEDALHERSAAQ